MSGFKPNFIVIRLCDNDYGRELDMVGDCLLEQDLSELFCSAEALKRAVVQVILGLNQMLSVLRGFSASSGQHAYLMASLSVAFQQHAPTEDHDSGSLCVDCNLGIHWRF